MAKLNAAEALRRALEDVDGVFHDAAVYPQLKLHSQTLSRLKRVSLRIQDAQKVLGVK